MKTAWLRNDYLAIALIILLALAVVFVPTVSRAAGGDEPEPCPIVGKAGGTNIYRCEDWEMGKVCYVNGYGFLFCLEE